MNQGCYFWGIPTIQFLSTVDSIVLFTNSVEEKQISLGVLVGWDLASGGIQTHDLCDCYHYTTDKLQEVDIGNL